ncbi:MAG: hypothetical protein A2V50_07160 [Bacteroidetes bacterium RBG_19FT_COMBO_42_10]|nr:MAG: hypothetical protein A2V50_07160 [Bacteroidetes bacterium RBG_19FT_COMBO_42_10]
MFSQQKSSHPFGLIFALLPKIKTVINMPAGNNWFSGPHDIQTARQKSALSEVEEQPFVALSRNISSTFFGSKTSVPL